MTTDFDLVSAARRVLTDRSDAALSALEMAIARRDVAMLTEHNTTLWAECADLKAALDAALRACDDAQRERDDFGATIDAQRARIAELERMVGEREGRIGGLEYDVADLTATIDAQRARIAELERTPPPAAPPPDLPVGRGQVVMPGRLSGAAKAAEAIAAEREDLPPCPHCDQRSFKSQISRTQHVNYCPKNPTRLRAPNSKAERAAKIAAGPAAAPAEQHAPWAPDADTGVYRCPDCGGTAFAKALRADRCVNCDNKARIGRAA